MDIRILRAADVRTLLPMPECIELMQRTMIAVSEGRAVCRCARCSSCRASGDDGKHARLSCRARMFWH